MVLSARKAYAVAASVLVATIAGCSLALPRLSAPACERDLDCERFNSLYPRRVTSCERYQCNEATRRCYFGPIDRDGDGHHPVVECAPAGDDCDDTLATVYLNRTEDCDGVDNDCDGVVDDGVPLEQGAAVAVGELGSVDALAWSVTATGATGIVNGTDRRSASLQDVDGPLGSRRRLTLVALPDPTDSSSATLEAGCPGTTDGLPTDACTFDRVAIASGDPRGWVAFVNTDGCADGQLRVGLVDAAGGRVELTGPDSRSNTWRGVDLEGACTSAGSGSTGAASPAVAATGDATAIVGWIRSRVSRGCEAPAAEVAALGLWRARGMVGGSQLDWIVGSDGGAPVIVGRTSGVAPPALVHTPAGDTFVAFGDENGGVKLARIEPLGALPAPLDPSSSPTLSIGESITFGAGPADSVALATSTTAGGSTVAVAWIAGCGSGELRLTTVEWNRSSRSFTAGVTEVLAPAAAARPALVHVARGFVRPELDRGAGPVGDRDGGWLVAWRDESMTPPATVAARVLEADGAVIDEVPLPIARELSADPSSVFLYPGSAGSERTARFVVHARDEQTLIGGTMLCAP